MKKCMKKYEPRGGVSNLSEGTITKYIYGIPIPRRVKDGDLDVGGAGPDLVLYAQDVVPLVPEHHVVEG